MLGKMKAYELAKELKITSKDLIERAKKLGIELSSHLSSLDDDQVSKIKKSYSNGEKVKDNSKKPSKESKVENKKAGPVIIRRQAILNDEEETKQEEDKKVNERKDIGFVKRRNNNDYNIVYRNKPNKPLTVNELFGLGKKEEKPKKEPVKEEKPQVVEEKKEEVKKPVETKTEQPKVSEVKETKLENASRDTSNNNAKRNDRPNRDEHSQRNNQYQQRNNYNNNNRYQNNNQQRDGFRQNNRYNNSNNGYNNNYRNNKNENYENRNNNFRNNNFNKGSRPLDDKRIDKKINDILETEIVEKENQRDYSTRVNYKARNSKNDELKQNKSSKSKRFNGHEEYDEGKLKNLKQVDRLSNMFEDQDGGMLDYYDLSTARGKKGKRKNQKNNEERNKQKIFKLTEITIPEEISVKDLATDLKKTSSEVIKKLLELGIMATINQVLDFDTAFLVAEEFGVTANKKEEVKEEDILFDESEDKEEDLVQRPPVVVVMGHVDHGKTSLLDAIRKTNVIEGEAGGITQHIGAYKVSVNGREITFLDTPGHEAFTSMRARGAQITDVAILVVAADDGVMPQTVEAINHAKAAGIPIVVAVNKIDLPGANPDKVKQELAEYGLVSEDWGGDTIFVPISAKKKINIDNLLEMVLLVADMKELKANPNKQAKGVVIEAKLDKSKGPVATMLVQRGTLDIGDTILVGSVIGRIRTMTDDKGHKVKKAGPSTPVEITGLTEVPEAGDTFYEVKDEKTAKHLMERRKRQARDKALKASSRVTLDDLFSQIEKGNLKQLNIIVKADVQGSVEAVKQALEKLSNDEVKVKVIHANVGAITESDVTLANVSNAIIIGFNVRPQPIAKDMADKENVEIKTYSVIYNAIEDVEAAMKGMLDPVFKEVVIGNAEVRQTFKISDVGTIAGCYVTNGKVARNAGVRRDNVVIHDGKLISLKRMKDDAKEVTKGFECGIQIENFNDIKEGDIIEAYIMEQVKQ